MVADFTAGFTRNWVYTQSQKNAARQHVLSVPVAGDAPEDVSCMAQMYSYPNTLMIMLPVFFPRPNDKLCATELEL